MIIVILEVVIGLLIIAFIVGKEYGRRKGLAEAHQLIASAAKSLEDDVQKMISDTMAGRESKPESHQESEVVLPEKAGD